MFNSSIPTDNLYKLFALGFLAAAIAALALHNQDVSSARSRYRELSRDSETRIQAFISNGGKDFRLDSGSMGDESLAEGLTAERLKAFKESEKAKIKAYADAADTGLVFGRNFWPLLSGIFMMISLCSFERWWSKVQKLQDEILVAQHRRETQV